MSQLRVGGTAAARTGRFRWHGAGGTGITKAVVYNTVEEIRRFGEVVAMITAGVT